MWRPTLLLVALLFSHAYTQLVTERFHRCFDEGEVYSASFLSRTAYLLTKDLRISEATQRNTELATFLMIETDLHKKYKAQLGAGKMFMTADFFEFSVIHLSAYERSMREVGLNDVDGPFVNRLHNLAALQKAKYVRALSQTQIQNLTTSTETSNRSNTLVVMPFFGLKHENDVGHSDIAKRLVYLEAAYYNIAAVFPNVVIGVANDADRAKILQELSLPVLNVFVLPRAQQHPQELPFLTLKEVQRRLRENEDNYQKRFRYLFYTESDQLLVIRDEWKLFEQLEMHWRDVIMPHRLIPYSQELLRKLRVRRLHSLPMLSSQPPLTASIRAWECRLTTAACSGNRSDFVPIRTLRKYSTLPLLNIDGLMVVFGHANFLRHLFRPCQLQRKS